MTARSDADDSWRDPKVEFVTPGFGYYRQHCFSCVCLCSIVFHFALSLPCPPSIFHTLTSAATPTSTAPHCTALSFLSSHTRIETDGWVSSGCVGFVCKCAWVCERGCRSFLNFSGSVGSRQLSNCGSSPSRTWCRRGDTTSNVFNGVAGLIRGTRFEATVSSKAIVPRFAAPGVAHVLESS